MTVKSLISDILYRAFNSTHNSFDVAIQDQTTALVDAFMSQKFKTDITLTADAAIGDETISVSAGHGFTASGEWIEIYEGTRWMQCRITGVSTNDITLEMPLPFDVTTTGAMIYRVGVDMNVDGSVTPVLFTFGPNGTGLKYDVLAAIISFADGSPMDGGTFGGITALTNGVYFSKIGDNYTGRFMNIRKNQDLIERCFSVDFSDKAPAGEYGLIIRRGIGGSLGSNGVAIRLDADANDYITAVVRDDITANTRFRVAFHGHVVED